MIPLQICGAGSVFSECWFPHLCDHSAGLLSLHLSLPRRSHASFWAKYIFREILSSKSYALLSECTQNPHYSQTFFFYYLHRAGAGETELFFFFFFVSAGPNQSLFIQVNHALMHECSLSDSPYEPHSGHLHFTICHWMGAVESDQLCSRSSHSFAYIWLSTALRQLTLETNKTQTFPKKAQMRLHTENHSSEAGPEFNRHLRARCKDQWFHNHFHCPLVKLLLCTLKSPTVLSTQIIPGRDGSCYFLVWRSEWQMDSSE